MNGTEVAPLVTPIDQRRSEACGGTSRRPHQWTTGAFYWPLGSATESHLYVGTDYVMCGLCGQIEADR